MYTALQHWILHKVPISPTTVSEFSSNYPLAPHCLCSAQFLSGYYLYNPLTTAPETEEIRPRNEELFFCQGPLDMYTSICRPWNTGKMGYRQPLRSTQICPRRVRNHDLSSLMKPKNRVSSILDLVYWTNSYNSLL